MSALRAISLSGNQLKVIAAVSMVIDHFGYIFFPQTALFRILGRLAFPIFAFMIAEGCRYTRHKGTYLAGIAGLAFLCQTAYFLFDGSTYMCIMVTFTLSVLTIYALQYTKRTLFSPDAVPMQKVLAVLLFLGMVLLVWALNQRFRIDYGFWGCMTPVIVSLFQQEAHAPIPALADLDRPAAHVFLLGIALLLVCSSFGWIQNFSLLTLPLLCLYSGQRGTWSMKYFFYLFYPIHLALLEGLYLLLH